MTQADSDMLVFIYLQIEEQVERIRAAPTIRSWEMMPNWQLVESPGRV
jgi:hypothetical protein